MLEVTPSAHQKFTEYFKEQPDISPIRIFLNQGGCGGPSLALALDDPQVSDQVFNINGFTYLVEKEFLAAAKPIKIDYSPMGFELSSSLVFEPGSGCGGCGGGCGSHEGHDHGGGEGHGGCGCH